MLKIKILAVLSIAVFVGLVVSGGEQFPAHAADDDVLVRIADYKSWAKITEEPIVVKSSMGAIAPMG